MRPFWKTAMIALAVALASCAQPGEVETGQSSEPAAPSDEEAVLSLAGQYIELYNAEDAEALAELFTLRAVRMPPGEPGFSGRSRIQQDLERVFAAAEGKITINVEDTLVNGDLAYARGTYATTTRPEGEGEEQEVGKWVNVLQREAGGPWRISTQIWNLDTR